MSETDKTDKKKDLITEELFREAYLYEDVRKPPLKQRIAKKLKCTKSKALHLFPIAEWLPKYNAKTDLLRDIIAGATVAVMHIPHGLAYAPLGRVEPVVGFYMAVFPVFIYMLLGTSRHISIGTFAVLCAMVGQIVGKYEDRAIQPISSNSTNTTTEAPVKHHENIEIGAAVCLLVGVWQTLLGLLHLGSVSVIMSESLVSGFTTGAAIHVLSYQWKNIFGVNVGSFSGVLKLFYLYVDFFSKIKTTNLVTLSISATCIFILFFFILYLTPLIRKKFPKNKIPIPIELIVLVLGILLSYFLKLSEKYNVKIVGNIPTGFPQPTLPAHDMLLSIILDSAVVAIVALAINLSLAKIFAKKSGYSISNNQELIAYGVGNLFSAFFRCLPAAASLSRSSVQFSAGGVTQLASLFSLTLMIFILLFAGPLFEPVPYCVLSSIVVVSLKGLLMQVTDLPKMWIKNYWDGLVWLSTFLAVVILDIDYGLGVGILLSLASIVFSTHNLQLSVMGRDPKTSVFLDISHYKSVEAVPNLLILHITGNLSFVNSDHFESLVLNEFNNFYDSELKEQSYVILDMTSVTKVDPVSVNILAHIYKYLQKSKCDLYLTNCNIKVYRAFEVCDLFKIFPKDQVLASVADAVEYLSNNS